VSPRALSAQVDLRDGETVRQDFHFENSMSVRGHIVVPSNRFRKAVVAAVRGTVLIENEQQMSEAIKRAGQESGIVDRVRGDYTIHLSEPGTYTVLAAWYEHSKPPIWASQVVTIEEGQTVVVDFEP
jgi:hypothetical protein